MTIVIVISFARECKTVPNAMHLNEGPNSSMSNQTEWYNMINDNISVHTFPFIFFFLFL